MSILIKGMEMPKSCGDCPIGDSLCCPLMPGVPALWKEYTIAVRTNRRHSDCPLIEVPEDVQPVKHGRWINICGDSESPRQCSECLQDFDYIDGICYLVSGQRLPLYCPNCGAKMDGAE